MSISFQRTITNELHSLESLMNGITNFLEDQGVDAKVVYRINLAMEEMITNIIKFGYDDYDTHNIHIGMEVDEHAVVAVIEDFGHAFNPLEQSKKAESLPEESKVGGLGIHLIKTLLDSMTYRRDGDRNILELRMSRHPEST